MRQFVKKHLQSSSSITPEVKTFHTPFQYDALQDDEIRLFRMVDRGPQSKDVHLEIQHFPINTTTKYLAISYAWGRPSSEFPESWDSPQSLMTVHINGHEFQVRQNLF